jgi:hypothetical protein
MIMITITTNIIGVVAAASDKETIMKIDKGRHSTTIQQRIKRRIFFLKKNARMRRGLSSTTLSRRHFPFKNTIRICMDQTKETN